MQDLMYQNRPGWKITQSIAMEMDAALAIACGHLAAARMSPEFEAIHHSVPEDWKLEWEDIQSSVNWFNAVLEYAAVMSGVLEEADYTRAAMVLRQTTVENVMQNLKQLTSGLDLNLIDGLTVEESVIQLFLEYRNSAFQSIGFSVRTDHGYEKRTLDELRFCLSIFQGGAMHDRFWHWLDRFYFEVYHPWRLERQFFLDGMTEKLITELGSPENSGVIPDLNWLPEPNPALRYPEIKSAIQSGEVFVHFWLEPFGFADYWTLLPGKLFLSFAEPGAMYENFKAIAASLSNQVKALADPTRLVILRIIRELSMTNTDMADLLQLARPTVSIHAKILREAGLIRSWDEGRITRHEIIPEAVNNLFRELEVFLDLPKDQKNSS